MKRIIFFNRKPFTDYHSIENLFETIQNKLPKTIPVTNYTLSYYSSGLLNRIRACFEVINKQGDINHITGDVHFISYFLKKQKTILTIHDLVPLKNNIGIRRALLKYFWFVLPAQRVRFLTVISNFTKEELLKEIKVNPSKIKVIMNPVSEKIKFTPKKFIIENPILLQVGTAKNKNLTRLIAAVHNLDISLYILGNLSAEQKNNLKEKNIRYKNFYNLNFDEVINLYKQADIICFASLYEGFGLPIVEGQATGRPVITSNICSMPEVAGNGALFIDPYSIVEYRKAILSLIADEDLRNDLIDKGRVNVLRFDNQTISNAYLTLYKEI